MQTYQKISLFLAAVTAVVIFYVSTLQFPPNPFPQFSLTSLIYHAGIFFLLTLFLLLSGMPNFNREFIFIVLLASFAYAGLDELHQVFVPNRVADIFDFSKDAAGSLISLAFLGLMRRIRK
ncbi:MAG TPA: VanZ family protein [Candidatus Nanoarchaeia archaeon]|nr:VanZ family protein [Candidatus Nanoarchaeia archaeon]